MDFTLKIYRELLLALQHKGYSFFTFQQYCDGKAAGKYVILRHDIDKNPNNALRFAQLEAEMGIKSTYFFLILKEIFKPTVIKQIAELGHEIGYHYRDFVDAGGNAQKSIYSFEANLKRLRDIVPINTIAMDGCPWSKYDNRNIWKTNNYRDYGIIGEPYFDVDFNKVFYLTDTGRMWDGERYSVRDKVVSGGKMVDSSEEMVDGSSEMVVGSGKMVDSSEEMVDGSSEMVDGSGKMVDGSGKMVDSSEEMVDGSSEMVDGSGKMVDSSGKMVDSSEEMVDSNEGNNLQSNNYKLQTTNKLQTIFHSTHDIIRSVQFGSFPSRVMITTHPQRWTDNRVEWLQELILQRVKNVVKWMLLMISDKNSD